ncbi:MAG TPA: NAD(P)H-quinone oxidoreductase [Gammaproteobacteria bacterium]|nr:NAD(P)H-quinone oxidoreductase [Gammaproteobacteria bacterium]
MKAIAIDGDHLTWREHPGEACGPGHIRIRVAASAVNRADLLQRRGGYSPPPGTSDILGLECSGEVAEVGEGVQRFKVGDAVCALLAGGGYADEVVVPAGQALPIPKGIDLIAAAAIPEVFATAYLNLYLEAGLKPQQRVLVHAGASGVGTAAIQLLRLSHNPTFVTAGSSAKVAQCVALGADRGHDRHAGSFMARVEAWSAGEGVDVILDPVGGQYFQDNLQVLGLGGRLVVIGLMGGAQTDFNLATLMLKRLRVIGSTLRARSPSEKSLVMDALYQRVWPAFESGQVQPIIEASMPITQAHQAHERLAGNETVGKILLLT